MDALRGAIVVVLHPQQGGALARSLAQAKARDAYPPRAADRPTCPRTG
ncbi:hypothetical protein IG631_18536 [Alternaria alternata]|nr:hypothetical protein IG631_18536 [Alternaria alternata]